MYSDEYRKKLIDLNEQAGNMIKRELIQDNFEDVVRNSLRPRLHPATLMVLITILAVIAFVCIEICPDQTIGKLQYQPPPGRSWHWSQDGGQISVYRGADISVIVTEDELSIWYKKEPPDIWHEE